jgi:hypothetical protein
MPAHARSDICNKKVWEEALATRVDCLAEELDYI